MNKKIRSKKMITVLMFCCVALMVVVTIACLIYFKKQVNAVSLAEIQPKKYEHYFAFISADNREGFFEAVYESAVKEGEAKNDYVEYMGRNLAVAYTKHQLMDIAISSKVDGIILEGDEGQETIDLINEAVSAGIPVITVGSDCTGSNRQSFVGVGFYNLGQEYGRQILRLVSDKRKKVLVLMSPNADDSTQNIIYSGIKDTVEVSNSAQGFDIETLAISEDTTFGAEESIRDIITNSAELPDIIVCLNELNTTCAYQAIVDYNKVGAVKILGYYQNESILNAIQKDIINCSITVDTEQMGRYCVDALNEYKVSGYVNEYMSVDTQRITSENVGEFMTNEENEE